MKIQFDKKMRFSTRKLLKKGLVSCLKLLGQPHKVEVVISVVDEKEMKKINGTQRNVHHVTDVLSFPTFEMKAGEILRKTHFSAPTYHKGYVFLGDIVLCASVAEKQAKKLKHSLDTEFLRLSVHSLLHLLGFDHEKEEDFQKMNEIEQKMGFGTFA